MFAFLMLLMAYLFSVGCCCDTGTTTLEPGVANANATAIAPTISSIVPCASNVCEVGTTPQQFKVTFASVKDDSRCSECTNWNSGGWILDKTVVDNCAWEFTASLPCDGETFPSCKIRVVHSLNIMQISVHIITGGICGAVEAVGSSSPNLSNPRDCDATFSVNMADGALNSNCDYSDNPAVGTAEAL